MFAKEADRVIMSVSPGNEMHFLWSKFIRDFDVDLVYDTWNAGDWPARWEAWDKWRHDRSIEGRQFSDYRELYLRIHGYQRQMVLCGEERGLRRKNIYEYWYFGQENRPTSCIGSDVYDVEIDHPALTQQRDVYISPHCKTQGNATFTFDFWSDVIHRLVEAGISVTVGYSGAFCDDLQGNPLYRKHWGDHKQWMESVCSHRLVACGNTGTGWLAAACGVPLLTMEPHNSCMADHRYRECGLRNLVEVVDGHTLDSFENDMVKVAGYVAERIAEFCQGKPAARRVNQVREVAEACRAGAQYSVNPYEKLKLMADEFLKAAHLDGDVADLGSYRGGSALVLRKLCNKHLHLFDTWEGNPYDDPLCHHKRGEWKASIADCWRLINGGTTELLTMYPGVFPGTISASNYASDKFCFVYIDMDTYQATKDAIEFFWPRLAKGGVLFFDDYGWEPCAGVKKAVDEFFVSADAGTKTFAGYSCIITKG